MDKPEKSEKIPCPNCSAKLLSKEADGQYHWRKGHGKNCQYWCKFMVGSIVCPKCKTEVAIPPLPPMQAK